MTRRSRDRAHNIQPGHNLFTNSRNLSSTNSSTTPGKFENHFINFTLYENP